MEKINKFLFTWTIRYTIIVVFIMLLFEDLRGNYALLMPIALVSTFLFYINYTLDTLKKIKEEKKNNEIKEIKNK